MEKIQPEIRIELQRRLITKKTVMNSVHLTCQNILIVSETDTEN